MFLNEENIAVYKFCIFLYYVQTLLFYLLCILESVAKLARQFIVIYAMQIFHKDNKFLKEWIMI